MIRTIEGLAAGTPTADMLVEYKDAIESKAGYEYTAAYLNGIKKGFQLAMFIGPLCLPLLPAARLLCPPSIFHLII